MPDPLLAVSLLLVLIPFTALSAELSMTNLLVRLELGLTFFVRVHQLVEGSQLVAVLLEKGH